MKKTESLQKLFAYSKNSQQPSLHVLTIELNILEIPKLHLKNYQKHSQKLVEKRMENNLKMHLKDTKRAEVINHKQDQKII